MKSQEKIDTTTQPNYDVEAVGVLIREAQPLNVTHTQPEDMPATEIFPMSDVPETEKPFHAPDAMQRVGRKFGSFLTGKAGVQTTANVQVSEGFERTPTTYNPSRRDVVGSIRSTRETTVGNRSNPTLRVSSTHTASTRKQENLPKKKPDTAELTETRSIELQGSAPSVVERKVTFDGKGNVQVEQKHTTENGRVNARVWSSDEQSPHYSGSAKPIAGAVQRRTRAVSNRGASRGLSRTTSGVGKRDLGIARAKLKVTG